MKGADSVKGEIHEKTVNVKGKYRITEGNKRHKGREGNANG